MSSVSTLPLAFGCDLVEISLISPLHTHALCMHTQQRLGGRHRPACRHGTAAHRPHLAAHTLLPGDNHIFETPVEARIKTKVLDHSQHAGEASLGAVSVLVGIEPSVATVVAHPRLWAAGVPDGECGISITHS